MTTSRHEIFALVQNRVEERMLGPVVGCAVNMVAALKWDILSKEEWATVYHNLAHWHFASLPTRDTLSDCDVRKMYRLAKDLALHLHTAACYIEQAAKDDHVRRAAKEAASEAKDAFGVATAGLTM